MRAGRIKVNTIVNYYKVLDFTASGRMRFERFYEENANPDRRLEFIQALDECLSRLEDQINAGHVLAWPLPAHYARASLKPFVFLPTAVDLVIEQAEPDQNALDQWAQPLLTAHVTA